MPAVLLLIAGQYCALSLSSSWVTRWKSIYLGVRKVFPALLFFHLVGVHVIAWQAVLFTSELTDYIKRCLFDVLMLLP